MAEVFTTRPWNGVKVYEFTNTDTGVIELRDSASFGRVLATGDAKGKWKLNDKSRFLRNYNRAQKKAGKPELTEKEFDKKFFTEGTDQFNEDRATELNNPDNYSSPEEYAEKAKAHAENGIPDVKNPEDGTINNREGDKVSDSENNKFEFNKTCYNTPYPVLNIIGSAYSEYIIQGLTGMLLSSVFNGTSSKITIYQTDAKGENKEKYKLQVSRYNFNYYSDAGINGVYSYNHSTSTLTINDADDNFFYITGASGKVLNITNPTSNEQLVNIYSCCDDNNQCNNHCPDSYVTESVPPNQTKKYTAYNYCD